MSNERCNDWARMSYNGRMRLPTEQEVSDFLKSMPAREAAAITQVSPKTVYRWRWGQWHPTIQQLRALVEGRKGRKS